MTKGKRESIANKELIMMKKIIYFEFFIPKYIGILFSPTIKSPFKEIIFFTISLEKSIVNI